MKAGARLVTERLVLRHWSGSETDRAAFHRLNNDESVMRFFPYRMTREQADARLEAIAAQVSSDGFGWGTACLKDTAAPIAYLGLARTWLSAKFGDVVEIGWRFLPEAWGKGLATEAARALIDHGFSALGLNGIVAFAAEVNAASRGVMQRIGMRHEPALDFDHPNVPAGHPDLSRHVFYRIDRPQSGDRRDRASA